MSVREGDAAPAFELPHRPGETIDLADHIGWDPVVLLFFPLAFSSVCTKEMCRIRDDWAGWEDLDARVFGVCVDSPFVTFEFRERERLPFPILSDFNKEASELYGVLREDLMGLRGVANRSVFVVGRDGRVRYAWVSEDPSVEPEYDAIRNAVAEA